MGRCVAVLIEANCLVQAPLPGQSFCVHCMQCTCRNQPSESKCRVKRGLFFRLFPRTFRVMPLLGIIRTVRRPEKPDNRVKSCGLPPPARHHHCDRPPRREPEDRPNLIPSPDRHPLQAGRPPSIDYENDGPDVRAACGHAAAAADNSTNIGKPGRRRRSVRRGSCFHRSQHTALRGAVGQWPSPRQCDS